MNTPGSWEERFRRRMEAIGLLEEGLSAAETAARLGVSRRSVERWRAAYRQGGVEALWVQKRTGAKPKLSARQRRDLQRRLLAGARSQGFPDDLWTGRRVQQLIQRRYGVQYHWAYIPRLLRQLGFTPQKPQPQARQRDEATIARWKKRCWPRIQKK